MNDTKQTSKAPAFSVIMPTYNRAFCIRDAIDSLLKQTYQQFELIIVDDGSTDRTEQLIQKFYQKYLKSGKFKYIKLNHVGVSAARNVGIKEAKNEWITYLDTDNYLLSNALGIYSYNISKNPGQQNFYGKFISKTTKEVYGKLFDFEDIKKQNTIDLGVYLHTKNLIEKCGAFDETLKRFVDWEMIARHCAYSHPILINEIVMEYNDSRKFQRITTSEPEAKSYSAAYDKIKNLTKSNEQQTKQKKIVVYTCITSKYDTLKQPLIKSPNIDFICFTDNLELYKKSSVWTIKKIPTELSCLSPIKQQRAIKICPHKYFKDYDISIWVDGSIQIKDDLNKFIELYDLEKIPLYVRKHPERNCIYQEAYECIKQKKDSAKNIDRHVKELLIKNNYPKNNGLAETNILLRKHNDVRCKKICNDWIKCVLNYSYRDQLSFDYVCYNNNFQYGLLTKQSNIQNDSDQFFEWLQNHKQTKYFSSKYITIAICNFNTTKLTNNCIRSINNNIKNYQYKIILLDNSNKEPFKLDDDNSKIKNITILDNTKNQLINFSKVLKNCPYRLSSQDINNYASLKHAYSIQYLLDICQTKFMLLFDSDTILLRDIDFINDSYITAATIEQYKKFNFQTRLVPYIQLFNLRIMNIFQIRYFDYSRIHGSLGPNNGNSYDTGASFYADILAKKLPIKQIQYTKYIKHLARGSWNKEFMLYKNRAFFKIIIPNYNNISYIQRCLDSILCQTFQNFKIIIVDDKSTDLSDKICELYSKKYSDKIVFIRAPKKLFAGGCRNIGIDYELSSKFTWFIDGDDFLHDNHVLEAIYNGINMHPNHDMYTFKYKIISSDKNNGQIYSWNIDLTNKNFLYCNNMIKVPWLKVIKSNLVEKFQEESLYGEDTIQFIKQLMQTTDLKQLDIVAYCYNLLNLNSETKTVTSERLINHRQKFIKELEQISTKIYNIQLFDCVNVRLNFEKSQLKILQKTRQLQDKT